MPTTTNYGWTTPADTDLVKDGASAIRTLGTAIDTTVFNNASAAIAKTIVDAKGDLIAATAADTVARLAVGSNNQVLTADSSTATGLKWASPAGGKVLQVVSTTYSTTTTISTTSFTDSGLSLSITPSANTSKVLVLVTQSFQHDKASGNQVDSATILLRDSTQIYAPYSGNATIYRKSGGATNQDHQELITMAYLDSPATTSSTTYKTQGQCASGCTLRYQFNSIPSTITLLEIGA